MCYGLSGVMDPKKGQIAHLDRDPSNSKIENLAYLCLECHAVYDSRSNRILSFTAGEIAEYRSKLYRALGHDQVEWTITVRADRTEYKLVKQSIDKAHKMLRDCGSDVSLSETPIE